jgi:hypothetical protein
VDERSLCKTHLKNHVPLALACSRVRINIWNFMHCGLYRLLVNNGRVFGFMAQCITLLMLLFWSTISKRLRWSKNCCYLLHTGSNGRLLVELEYINKKKNNYIDNK